LGFGNGGKIQLQFNTRVLGEGTTMFFTPDGICGYGWSYEYKGGDGAQQLVCYTVGENALNAGALGDDAAVIAAAVSDLDNLYAGTPFTDAFVAGYWKEMSRMRNSKGGYSYPTLYSYPTDGGPSLRVDLAAPESTKLYFAGEATSNENSANVTGAMETGLRAAGEIDADHNPQ
jgi:monoamine oxidase